MFGAYPKSYGEMLQKMLRYNFMGTTVMLFVCNQSAPSVNSTFSHIKELFPLLNYAFYLVLAAFTAWVVHMVKLHDRVSDLLSLRKRFDVDEILVPLARSVGLAVTSETRECFHENRENLMYKVFYKYATTSKL